MTLSADTPVRTRVDNDVALAAGGDPSAFERLYRTHVARIHSLTRRMLGTHEADEVTQDIFVRTWQKLGQFRGESAFSTWLHRLVVNTCKDFAQAKQARRTEPLVEDERAARDGDPVSAAVGAETRRELGSCLAELPPAQATVVALKDAFDLGFAEISAATGLPVGTAKCYAHRGRERLRDRLSA
jgi:RNA polymerase sigma factor (sigma-70 family)